MKLAVLLHSLPQLNAWNTTWLLWPHVHVIPLGHAHNMWPVARVPTCLETLAGRTTGEQNTRFTPQGALSHSTWCFLGNLSAGKRLWHNEDEVKQGERNITLQRASKKVLFCSEVTLLYNFHNQLTGNNFPQVIIYHNKLSLLGFCTGGQLWDKNQQVIIIISCSSNILFIFPDNFAINKNYS